MFGYHGEIHLPTKTAIAIWRAEILGQMSDGMWENCRQSDHWKFWHDMTPVLGSPVTMAYMEPIKDKYNLSGLIPVLGDRMLKIGRMTMALLSAGVESEDLDALHASDYMPPTFSEWDLCKNSGVWKYDFVKKYMDKITPEIAKSFYVNTFNNFYGKKDLLRDLKYMKEAMKNFVYNSNPSALLAVCPK